MSSELVTPGLGRGLRDVVRSRFLLKLLVAKELKVRYRGSVLGLLWSYVKPGVQFIVFWFALGVFLGMNDNTENYPIYLFSGIILINFFTEALGNASRSIVGNGGLIKKIYLPRELFPVASVWVSAVHFVPQLVVLLIACLFTGWTPGILELVAAVAGFGIVALLATGLGLFFGAANVYFRDSENFVDMLLMIATWASPVLYSWTMVRDTLGSTFLTLYQINPLTIAVELFHFAFWKPTTSAITDPAVLSPPNLFAVWTPVGVFTALAVILLGQFTFRRLEGRFAQEL
ncbi:ABC-2 type transport system permease protein [Arthrobacter pigmenti]|uniref:Transport permease protein n=1 Tax=Arthrobacter pigmenti TaxID=271432 RepID=A0A846RPB5_9MICC|nr:ABC transporter permease [Arthrobacter pigmenti]NJC22919.1 ABC-2 type transport system permease protein [Arthrobacter pigmenti]